MSLLLVSLLLHIVVLLLCSKNHRAFNKMSRSLTNVNVLARPCNNTNTVKKKKKMMMMININTTTIVRALSSSSSSMKIFKGGKDEVFLGARENLLNMIETKNEKGIDEALDELKRMYVGDVEKPARSTMLIGKWKLLWSKQPNANVNPFQKMLAAVAKDTNFQIVSDDSVVNDVMLFGDFIRVKAFGDASMVSDVRTNVTINVVELSLFGNVVKRFEIKPTPGKGVGYVEQLYLDEKIRVSVGNKGSLFVHERCKDSNSNNENEDDDDDDNSERKESTSLAIM